MLELLDHIRMVLIRTSHPGNIGASARAMKNMGLSHLTLVEPKHFPDAEANTRSSGADDLLDTAVVVSNLNDAIQDCQLVIGTSSRTRSLPWPLLSVRECVEKITSSYPSNTHIAFLFGSERTGLTNEELARCNYHVYIPCNPEFYSLNLAAAVQVIAYELRVQCLKKPQEIVNQEELASSEEMKLFYDHLEKTLVELKFLNPQMPKQLMLKLRRLFSRAHPEKNELNILRGILTAIDKQGLKS